MGRNTMVQIACGLTLVGVLSGCGGGGSTGPSSSAAPGQQPAGAPAGPPVSKTLVVDLDGVTFNTLSQNIAAGKLPNLARLHIAPAYSGGVNGTLGQQPNLDTPGWATILTGTWADRHQINSDAPNQALQAATAFQTLKTVNTGKFGVAADSNGLATLLAADQNAGNLDTVTACAGVDSCVTQNGISMIDNGYSLVMAQYHSAEDAALNSGIGSSGYANALVQLDTALGSLEAEIAKRGNENWLVVVTSSHGLNAAGGTDGLPLPLESTSFIGMNLPPNARLANAAAPTTFAALYADASIADVTPTLLAYMGASPAPATYAFDGGQLLGDTPVSQLSGTTGSDHLSLVLNWAAPANSAISVLRDGQTIASLPAGATTFTDSQLGLSVTGVAKFNYTVVAGSAPLSSIVPVDYVQPPPPPPPPPQLAATLVNSLSSYYPLTALPPVDTLSASTMRPWASDADGGTPTSVAGPFGGTGLQIDTHVVDTNGFDGYELTQTTDVTAQPQFTIGFWFLTSCTNLTSNGTPVIANKNYFSGTRAGIAIGLFPGSATSCNVRFNIGDGSVRNDINTLNVSANQWDYIALTIDTVAKTMSAYIFDPVLGEQKSLGTVVTINEAQLPGLHAFGLNEDGTGTYYMNACSDTPPYTVGECATTPPDVESFSDLALWSRTVTETELQSIFGSGTPLSSLIH
jgi:hypothetical protein